MLARSLYDTMTIRSTIVGYHKELMIHNSIDHLLLTMARLLVLPNDYNLYDVD